MIPRFIWNFFRLENEHLNNCGNFRAVRDISVAPIDASDQAQIIKLMDESEPRNHFRNRKKAFKNKELTLLQVKYGASLHKTYINEPYYFFLIMS